MFGPSNTYFDSTVNSGADTDYIELPVRSANSAPYGTSWAKQSVRVAANGTASGTATSAGTLRMVGFWTPPYDNPNAPVPEKVTVLFSPNAFALMEKNPNRSLTVDAVDVDSGFGDAAVYTYDPPNSYRSTDNYRWTSSGKHLRTFDARNGAWETTQTGKRRWKVQLPLSLTSSASISASGSGFSLRGGSPATLTAFAGGLGVEPDTREVKLSRVGARGPVYQWYDPALTQDVKDKYEWEEIKNGVWTRHGHTTYSYYERRYIQGEPPLLYTDEKTNWQHFTATRLGTWGNAFNWLSWWWDPTGGLAVNPLDGDTIDQSKKCMHLGSARKYFNGNWYGGPTGKTTRNQTYKVLERGDNTQAIAKYELTLHDPFENIPGTYSVVDIFKNHRRVGGPIKYPGTPGGERSVEVSYSMTASLAGGPAEWMANHLGINIEATYTDTTTVTRTISGPPLEEGQMTYIELSDHYRRHTGANDVWNKSGYVGTETYQIDAVPTDPEDRIGLGLVYPYLPYSDVSTTP